MGWTPVSADVANAKGPAYAGLTTHYDPRSYPTESDVAKAFSKKWDTKPLSDEVLGFRNAALSDSQYGQQLTCGAGDAVGDPVYLSGNNTVAKADATTAAKAKVVGFIRHKGSYGAASVGAATTCYISHFRYVSGLSGGTAGAAVYLTDAGGFSASAGTVSKIVGTFISTTEAYVYGSAHGVFALSVPSGVLNVAQGGTGLSSATAYAVLCGGTTSTGAFQSIAGVGTSGQVLTSNGAGALPTFQDAGVSGGTASFLAKYTSATALAISAYGDDGTYGTFMGIGSSTFNDASTLMKWRGSSAPATFTHGSAGGTSIHFRAQDAFATSNGNGADFQFTVGNKDGSGTEGGFQINYPLAGNYLRFLQNASGGSDMEIRTDFTQLRFTVSGSSSVMGLGVSTWKHFGSSGAVSIGQTTRAFGVGYFRGVTADSGQPVNILEPGASSVSDANTFLRANTSAPSAYTNAADTDGKHCIFRAQSGGTHSAANPDGGDFRFILSAKGSGGAGSDGWFKIYDSTVAQSFRFLFSGGDGTLGLDSGNLYFACDSGEFQFDSAANKVMSTAALATSATAGHLAIPNSAGKPTGTPTTSAGTPLHGDTSNHVVWGYLNSQWAQIGGAGTFLSPIDQVLPGFLPLLLSTGMLLVADKVYWQYLGYTLKPCTIKYIKFHVATGGAGAQTAEIALGSSASAPNGSNQTITKLAADGTLDDLTGTGLKGNTNSLNYACAAGVHLWAGIRTNMATTQPTIQSLGRSLNSGVYLSTATAGALTGAGPWTGAVVTHTFTEIPHLTALLN